MFVLKTKEELEKLTQEQQVAYAVEKANFEQKERERLDKEISEIKTKIDNLKIKNDDSLKDEIQNLKELMQKQELSIETLGRNRLTKQENIMENKALKIAKVVQDIVNKGSINKSYRLSEGEKKEHNNTISFEEVKNVVVKDAASDTHTTSDVPSSVYPNGSLANVSSSFISRRAQYMGFFTPTTPMSDFIDYMNVEELVEGHLYADYIENTSGDAEFVPECGVKPLILIDSKSESKKAGKVAVGIRLTEEYQRFVYKWVQNKVLPYLEIKLMNELHNNILNGNITYAFGGLLSSPSTFVIDPDLAGTANPNFLDAIGAAITQRYGLGYASDIVLVSHKDRYKIEAEKGVDGHYQNNNNSSIIKINGETYFNGVTNSLIKVSKDIEAGKFAILDLNQVFLAIDPELIIRSGYDKDGDLGRNILTIFFEKFFAVYKPTVNSGAVFYDSYANVISAIS